MTEFLTKPSPKAKTVAKLTGGGGLGVGALVFLYATVPTKSDTDASERRAAAARQEMREDIAETWRLLMDVQNAVEANRAALDMMMRLSRRVTTNAVASQ